MKKTTTDVKRLLTNTTFDTKTGEVENKIPDVRRSILIQKAEKFKTKLLSILYIYIYIYIYIWIITSYYNKLTGPMFDTRLKESKLATIKVFTTLGESAIKKQMK